MGHALDGQHGWNAMTNLHGEWLLCMPRKPERREVCSLLFEMFHSSMNRQDDRLQGSILSMPLIRGFTGVLHYWIAISPATLSFGQVDSDSARRTFSTILYTKTGRQARELVQFAMLCEPTSTSTNWLVAEHTRRRLISRGRQDVTWRADREAIDVSCCEPPERLEDTSTMKQGST